MCACASGSGRQELEGRQVTLEHGADCTAVITSAEFTLYPLWMTCSVQFIIYGESDFKAKNVR